MLFVTELEGYADIAPREVGVPASINTVTGEYERVDATLALLGAVRGLPVQPHPGDRDRRAVTLKPTSRRAPWGARRSFTSFQEMVLGASSSSVRC